MIDIPNNKSPFIIGNVIKEPEDFWGRENEIQDILGRLRKTESTSIIGSRRIGKTSLAYYIYKVAPSKLDQNYEFVWLDGQSNHTQSLNKFFQAIASLCTLNYNAGIDKKSCLLNFEDAIKSHSKKIVIIINELETLTNEKHRDEFDESFFMTLRLLASESHCALITTSYTSLKELCKYVLETSSPFYNIFLEMKLSNFTLDEADSFLKTSHGSIVLSESEISFVKKISDYQHPLVLQIACDEILKNRTLNLGYDLLKEKIENQKNYFLSHEEVQEGRDMKNKPQNDKNEQNISKTFDLLFSILIPVTGVVILMVVYGLLIRNLNNFQAVLLGLVSTMLIFLILVFGGRYIKIIGETTFYKLFLQLVKQLPLLSSLADNVIKFSDKLSKRKP